MAFIRSYVVPEGFPDSVTPSYVPYMTWRALKVLCGTYVQQSAFTCYSKEKSREAQWFVHYSALLWWSDGGVYNKNLVEFCWSLSKQGDTRCHCYQLDTQGKNIMSIQELSFLLFTILVCIIYSSQ